MYMSTFAKSAAVGITAGCVTLMVAGNKDKKWNHKSKNAQKKAQHAVKTIGGAMDELASIIR